MWKVINDMLGNRTNKNRFIKQLNTTNGFVKRAAGVGGRTGSRGHRPGLVEDPPNRKQVSKYSIIRKTCFRCLAIILLKPYL